MLCGLADGVDALAAQGLQIRRVLLIGGAARSEAVQRVAPELFGVPVVVPAAAEYVALGAARQAAWATADDGGGALPSWPRAAEVVRDPVDVERGAEVRVTYRELRQSMHPG